VATSLQAASRCRHGRAGCPSTVGQQRGQALAIREIRETIPGAEKPANLHPRRTITPKQFTTPQETPSRGAVPGSFRPLFGADARADLFQGGCQFTHGQPRPIHTRQRRGGALMSTPAATTTSLPPAVSPRIHEDSTPPTANHATDCSRTKTTHLRSTWLKRLTDFALGWALEPTPGEIGSDHPN